MPDYNLDEAKTSVQLYADRGIRHYGSGFWSAYESQNSGEAFVYHGFPYSAGVNYYRSLVDAQYSYDVENLRGANIDRTVAQGEVMQPIQVQIQNQVDSVTPPPYSLTQPAFDASGSIGQTTNPQTLGQVFAADTSVSPSNFFEDHLNSNDPNYVAPTGTPLDTIANFIEGTGAVVGNTASNILGLNLGTIALIGLGIYVVAQKKL